MQTLALEGERWAMNRIIKWTVYLTSPLILDVSPAHAQNVVLRCEFPDHPQVTWVLDVNFQTGEVRSRLDGIAHRGRITASEIQFINSRANPFWWIVDRSTGAVTVMGGNGYRTGQVHGQCQQVESGGAIGPR